jgi:hypothetical protein
VSKDKLPGVHAASRIPSPIGPSKHQASLCRAFVASVLLAGGLHAQAQPAGSGLTVPVRMEAIRQRIDGALADHAYNGPTAVHVSGRIRPECYTQALSAVERFKLA